MRHLLAFQVRSCRRWRWQGSTGLGLQLSPESQLSWSSASQDTNASPLRPAVPPWALATILLVSGLLLFSCGFCLCRKRCRKRMGKKSQAQAQVHLQEVKELGRSYIDKVRPGRACAPSLCTPCTLGGPAGPSPCTFPQTPVCPSISVCPAESSEPEDGPDLGAVHKSTRVW